MNENLEEKIELFRKDCSLLNESVKRMLDAGAKEKTILVLLNHYTGLPQRVIKQVMNGMLDLENEYFGNDE